MFYWKKTLNIKKNRISKKCLNIKKTIKTFEYLPLGSQLKKQTDIAIKLYQNPDNMYEFHKKQGDETNYINKSKKCVKSYLFYSRIFTFDKYNIINKFLNILFLQIEKI